ncbi:lasso peptide biosynthesis B2 protein [Actinoalloteichus caeruleus]|uniref:lasso peptide biosynthesis B2 protein n=1 Tax=Actinoalloteichus cyanogriseus TaxID=2893586 RepID=UPI003AAE5E83
MEAYHPGRAAPSWRAQIAVLVGIATALVALRLPMRVATSLCRWTRRRECRRISARQAARLVAAVRWTARRWPGRFACLETSLATVLAARILGLDLQWALGVRFSPPPTSYHAWVHQPGHGPAGEYTVGGWHYHCVLVI